MIVFCLLASCGMGTKIDRALGLIEQAIVDVRDTSGDWQGVLRELQADLIEAGQTTISNEVDNVVQRGIGGAQVSIFCTGDFVRDRVAQSLKQVADRLRNRPPRPLPPKVCKAIPPTINGYLSPDRRFQIDIVGYDMDSLQSQKKLELFLIDEGQSPRNVTAEGLAIVTHYEATINLGRTGVPISEGSRRLELRHPEMTTTHIGIIHPLPPPPEPATIRIGTRGPFVPPKFGGGDRDFKSHGPCVTAGAEIRVQGDKIENRIFMEAYECKSSLGRQSDFTHAKGWSSWKPALNDLEPGSKILRVLSPTSSRTQKYRDTDHGPKNQFMGVGDLVHTYTTVGDTSGNDVGAGTEVTVVFNPVRVLVQKPVAKNFITEQAFRRLKTEILQETGAVFVPRSMARN